MPRTFLSPLLPRVGILGLLLALSLPAQNSVAAHAAENVPLAAPAPAEAAVPPQTSKEEEAARKKREKEEKLAEVVEPAIAAFVAAAGGDPEVVRSDRARALVAAVLEAEAQRLEELAAEERAKIRTPLVRNDAIVLAMLLAILGFVFWTSSSSAPFWKTFYKIIPSLLLCYFLPSVLTNLGIINPKLSNLYPVARDYLLPTSLVLLTLSIDLKGVFRLGPKALVMFFTATAGIFFGGPLAILVVSLFAPEWVGGDVWGGMATAAGSWIGGGANQAAMKETFEVADDMFSAFIAVDVLVANVWMAGLLLIARNAKKIDARMGADTTAIDDLRRRVEDYQASVRKIPTTAEIMVILAVGFAVTALGHFVGQQIVPRIESMEAGLAAKDKVLTNMGLSSNFFWIVVTATTGAIFLSFTRVRRLEGAGASRLGTVMLYVLVATIGMKMDISAVAENPQYFVVGGIWMAFHVGLLFVVAKLIKAPMFFLAVGSKANVGGAASAPIIAGAFHPALAPVGVLLAVLGYALGTYAALVCAWMMQAVAPA